MFKKKLSFLFIVGTLLLVGCASPLKAPPERDLEAKNFTATKDTAALYVFRNENFGGSVGLPIKVNGMDIGETGKKLFLNLT